jgi:hypothetical protein
MHSISCAARSAPFRQPECQRKYRIVKGPPPLLYVVERPHDGVDWPPRLAEPLALQAVRHYVDRRLDSGPHIRVVRPEGVHDEGVRQVRQLRGPAAYGVAVGDVHADQERHVGPDALEHGLLDLAQRRQGVEVGVEDCDLADHVCARGERPQGQGIDCVVPR